MGHANRGGTMSRGVLYMIVAAFFFSLMAATVKLLGGRIPSQELVVARSAVLFILSSFWIVKGRIFPFWGHQKKFLFLRGFFGFLALSAFFYTITAMPLADSVVIQYTSPLFTALWSPLILKEKISRHLWTALLLSFVGVIFIAKPGFSFQFIPALIGLAGAASAGLAYNFVRKLRQSEHPFTIILYLPAVSIPLSLPVVLPTLVIPRGMEWVWMALLGIFTFIAQVFLTRSLHLEKAAKSTNMSFTNIVFSSVWGTLFWGEIPDIFSILGALLILFGVYLAATSR